MAGRRPEPERLIDYDFLRFSADHFTEAAADQAGRPITWVDLALDYALSIEATRRGQAPEQIKITGREAAEAIRKYCGEDAYNNLPPARELSSAIRDKRLLRLAFGY